MNSKYDPKACAHCYNLHICTGTPQCPCFDLPVSEEILEYISDHFDECLCNDCMEELETRINYKLSASEFSKLKNFQN